MKNIQQTEDNINKIKQLEDEKSQLYKQLNIVQESLEIYYNKAKEYEQRNIDINNKNQIIVSTKVYEGLFENIKLHKLVEMQQVALQQERQNSLPARLGAILIKGVSSPKEFILLPVNLCKIWKSLVNTTPPSVLGGEDFIKVIDTYKVGGLNAVEKLLDSVFISCVMRANAYTTLARKLMTIDKQQVANLARLAWETDPRPYRLKWLAFRTHEAGDSVTADVILDMLPSDIKMSESEKRHIQRIHNESNVTITNRIKKLIEAEQQNISKNLKKNTCYSKDQQDVQTVQQNKLRNDYSQDLARLNEQLMSLQKSTVLAQQDAKEARDSQALLQQQMDTQKKESSALSLQTALMLKNMLGEFESEPSILSKILCIIMGSKKS